MKDRVDKQWESHTLFAVFCYIRLKKNEGQGKYVTFSNMHKESGESLKMATSCVA